MVSIDAAFLATADVGPGQADGPYPDMYEHWQGRHIDESCELPARPEHAASVAESRAMSSAEKAARTACENTTGS